MKCPRCGDPDSYTGLQWVHCKNEECYYFDARYKAKLEAELLDIPPLDSAFYDKVEKLILLRGELADDDS
jgi:hypothetical protein